MIDEPIDFDQDGKADLRVHWDAGTDGVRLDLLDSRVRSVGEVIQVGKGRVIRVNLSRGPN